MSPVRSPFTRTHADVHERHAGDGVVYAAVIDGLAEGEYHVWTGAPVRGVRIRGCVTEGGLRSPPTRG